jgi:hypothetical protein
MGLFGTTKRKKKSVTAQINKVKKALERKKQKATLASLKKQLRGY